MLHLFKVDHDSHLPVGCMLATLPMSTTTVVLCLMMLSVQGFPPVACRTGPVYGTLLYIPHATLPIVKTHVAVQYCTWLRTFNV